MIPDYPAIPEPRPAWGLNYAAPMPWEHAVRADDILQRATGDRTKFVNWDVYRKWLADRANVCPVCHNRTLEPGTWEPVGVGGFYRKSQPDRCPVCKYVEPGYLMPDPGFWFYVWCWEQQVEPNIKHYGRDNRRIKELAAGPADLPRQPEK